MTAEDIDRVVGDLAVPASFGVRLVCPIDEFNASRQVGDDSPALLPPPTPERVSEFFDLMKQRIATARKYGTFRHVVGGS